MREEKHSKATTSPGRLHFLLFEMVARGFDASFPAHYGTGAMAICLPVAVPPILENITSAIRMGAGFRFST